MVDLGTVHGDLDWQAIGDALDRWGFAVTPPLLDAEQCWSRRRLVATVHRELALAAKPLARLLRFERAVEHLRAGSGLTDVALDSGYYDQAHFNRDFKAFAGVTPTRYRAVTSVQDIRSVPA